MGEATYDGSERRWTKALPRECGAMRVPGFPATQTFGTKNLREANMPGTGTAKSQSESSDAEQELREKMDQREETRHTNEQNQQQDLNQGMATGTHSSAHGGIHWGPSYRMKSRIEQASPTKEQIAVRAHDLYLQRGRGDGQELEDWLTAEKELKQEHTKAN
jgi:hypothetical protein